MSQQLVISTPLALSTPIYLAGGRFVATGYGKCSFNGANHRSDCKNCNFPLAEQVQFSVPTEPKFELALLMPKSTKVCTYCVENPGTCNKKSAFVHDAILVGSISPAVKAIEAANSAPPSAMPTPVAAIEAANSAPPSAMPTSVAAIEAANSAPPSAMPTSEWGLWLPDLIPEPKAEPKPRKFEKSNERKEAKPWKNRPNHSAEGNPKPQGGFHQRKEKDLQTQVSKLKKSREDVQKALDKFLGDLNDLTLDNDVRKTICTRIREIQELANPKKPEKSSFRGASVVQAAKPEPTPKPRRPRRVNPKADQAKESNLQTPSAEKSESSEDEGTGEIRYAPEPV